MVRCSTSTTRPRRPLYGLADANLDVIISEATESLVAASRSPRQTRAAIAAALLDALEAKLTATSERAGLVRVDRLRRKVETFAAM